MFNLKKTGVPASWAEIEGELVQNKRCKCLVIKLVKQSSLTKPAFHYVEAILFYNTELFSIHTKIVCQFDTKYILVGN